MAERRIDLSGYYPEFLRNIRELRVITQTEEEELLRLYRASGGLWADGFIGTATVRGIRRWESLLGLRPHPSAHLEERRAGVLARWNQQLPYTLPRLRERLDAAVGRDGYELSVRNRIYKLELIVIDQSCRILQNLRDMTREMIPANLFFIFAGSYPMELPAKIQTASGLRLQTYFNPRNNREYLLLDGSWLLDGNYCLNGYKELKDWEFYPLELAIGSGISAGERFDAAGQTLVSRILQSHQLDAAAILQSQAAHPTVSDAKNRFCTGISVQWGTETRIETESYIKQAIAARAVNSASGSCREQASAHPGLEAANGAAIAVRGTAGLKIEKDLWHLDGSYELDGEKLLDAEIIEYNL